MSPIIVVKDVSFELPNGRQLFQDLCFSLQGSITAIVGPNGVGKTTLAKLIAGEITPAGGAIHRTGLVTYFPQRETAPPITIEAYLTSEYSWSSWSERLLEGIHREALCSTLSGGQWVRVRLARTVDDGYLILDEPSNDLDRAGRDALIELLRERRGGVLVISHDRECLELAEEVLELSNRGLSKFGGPWADYLEHRANERSRLQTSLNRAKRDRDASLRERQQKKARQEKRNRRGAEAAARGGLPKILMGARKRRAQVATGSIDTETLARTQRAVTSAHTALSELKLDPLMYVDLGGCEIHAQKLVAEARDFNIQFHRWLYPRDLNFCWRGNVRIAVRGGNGSGKTSLIRSILGTNMATRGELRLGGLNTLYLDQRCAELDDEKTVFENVQEITRLSESEIRGGLARFLFAKEAVFQKVRELSGGERLRATLARAFLSSDKPQLWILDEPTNNLDLANVQFLESLIGRFRGALLVISHDERFLEACRIQSVYDLSAKLD